MMDGPILPAEPLIGRQAVSRIEADYDRFREGMPDQIEQYILEKYGVDVSSRYGTTRIKNPFGKASGQLSVNLEQVKADARAGLGFVVLKTVIAENEEGQRSMKEWAVKETRMVVNQITGKETGELGWNVTWRGRGWYGTLSAYLDFFRSALAVGRTHGMVVVPSCKYHLPCREEAGYALDEYRHTTRMLLQVWNEQSGAGPLQMEKDFSPTVAGSGLAKQQNTVLEWLRQVPYLIKTAAGDADLQLGIKLMNTMFDDRFQLESIRTLLEEGSVRPDYVIYANRLYDSRLKFLGKEGAAYGGPDLSTRNLRILSRLRKMEVLGKLKQPVPPLSGTGNIHSGKMAVEYGLRGAESLQMHTIFQRPNSAFGMRTGSKTERALHELYFHPKDGLITWMLHVKEHQDITGPGGVIRFSDVASWYRNQGKEYFLYLL
ncbi:hypothetical protein [Paenibacillus sp. J22TS3]|uniref:hypothetical protein n=1 Tax=Paenibacillus sp. J22TS3 TaxID=2807192 RepID=UPI001BCB7256|nr:hypothetical protein [Paenibacillus sp. J22TS3]